MSRQENVPPQDVWSRISNSLRDFINTVLIGAPGGPAGYLRRVSGAQLAHELGTAFFERQQLSAAMADTFLEHLCLLDIDSEPVAARSTCIIATIGPASQSVERLKEMIKAGMNIARLNFSHGSHEYHAQSIANIREAVQSFATSPLSYRPVAIALDTKGPEIRTGVLRGGPETDVELVKGSRVLVTVDPAFRTRGDANTVWVDYPNIVKVVSVGSRIYIDDGLISLQARRGWRPTWRTAASWAAARA
uniref:pyruvate kinase n=1 Tax=Felis catus TaxID=9685 RepID=U5IBL4_FELCA|nr:pyruvate kinase isozyme R [Felis catus]